MPKPPIKEKYISTPEELLSLWDEYKATVDSKPDVQEIATGKGVHRIEVKRPYLRKGFEAYVYRKLGFNVHQYIDNWHNAYESYLGVVTCMRNEWEEDQIEGSLTGRYKAPNLVARLNGLVEKVQEDGTKELTIKVKYERKGSEADTAARSTGEDS